MRSNLTCNGYLKFSLSSVPWQRSRRTLRRFTEFPFRSYGRVNVVPIQVAWSITWHGSFLLGNLIH